jgi:hypothetical protein
MLKSRISHSFIDMVPAVIIFTLSLADALLFGDLSPLARWHVTVWMVLLRFFKFTIVILLPILFLPGIFNLAVRNFRHSLVQFEQIETHKVEPLKHWLSRPFQGIGIGFVFSAKLIAVLQLVSGPVDGSSMLIAKSPYQLGRFAAVTLVTVCVSLLLSAIWTFDDTGIRYYNKKDQELKMIGKYVGTIVPFIFGTYGILSLVANYSMTESLLLVIKVVIVLYPPMLVFTVLHTYFLKNKTRAFFTEYLPKGKIDIYHKGQYKETDNAS